MFLNNLVNRLIGKTARVGIRAVLSASLAASAFSASASMDMRKKDSAGIFAIIASAYAEAPSGYGPEPPDPGYDANPSKMPQTPAGYFGLVYDIGDFFGAFNIKDVAVEGRINGVNYAQPSKIMQDSSSGNFWYDLIVRADDSTTPGIEGGIPGQMIEIYFITSTEERLVDIAEWYAGSTRQDIIVDYDQDGLTDREEINYDGNINYNPFHPVSNPAGTDLNASLPDTDNDGLGDYDEFKVYHTNPLIPDTDNDGLSDSYEALTSMTNPLAADTDLDKLLDGEEVNTYHTNPLKADTDNDGLDDYAELTTYNTDPLKADTDNDGLNDYDEINTYTTNPLAADTDNDGLSDGTEVNTYKTNPLVADTDNDGLSDGTEVNTYKTNPLSAHSDYDGLSDGDEVNIYHTNPLLEDTDGDELWDGREVNIYHTDPLKADTDGDGLDDYAEVRTYLTDPLKLDTDNDGLSDGTEVNIYTTNPLAADTDNDGLSDGAEVNIYTTNPLVADTDNDGLSDSYEALTSMTNPLAADTDLDKLLDGEEVNKYHTDPLKADTDNDGLNDYAEIRIYTNPRSADTDNDGLDDHFEVTYSGDNIYNPGVTDLNAQSSDTDYDGLGDYDEVRIYNTNPLTEDTDNDGLDDGEEVNTHNTDPLLADTDRDEFSDGNEIETGYNPLECDAPRATEEPHLSYSSSEPETRVGWISIYHATEYRVFKGSSDNFEEAVPISDWLPEPEDESCHYTDSEGVAPQGAGCFGGCGGGNELYTYYWIVARNKCGESGPSPPSDYREWSVKAFNTSTASDVSGDSIAMLLMGAGLLGARYSRKRTGE